MHLQLRNLASLLALLCLLATGAAAGELRADLAQTMALRYDAATARVRQLGAATDEASKLALAKLLIAGVPAAPGNPMPKRNPAAASLLIEQLLKSSLRPMVQQAMAAKASLLARSDLVADQDAGKAIDRELAEAGYVPALSKAILVGDGLPAGMSEQQAETLLSGSILGGDYTTAQALAALLAASDPERSAALRKQALVSLTVRAGEDVSAATELGRRYLYGDGVGQDVPRALKLFAFAVTGGANAPLITLDEALGQNVPSLTAEAVKPLIVDAFGHGSTRAAELIVADAMGTPRFGFSSADARFAVSLMAEVGGRPAQLLAAKAYVNGLGAAPDIAAALPYVEALSKVDGLAPSAVLDVGDELETLHLPIEQELRYIEPLYRGVVATAGDEAEYRADRLLAAGAKAGVLGSGSMDAGRVASIVTALRQAGERGHARSLILLGDLYYSGIWVPLNNRQATQYYERSLALEPSIVARERLAKSLLLVKSTPFEEARYRDLVTELADEGSRWGQYREGLLLIEDGSNVAAGEDILLDLSAQAYAPAVRALLKHLEGVKDDARIDKAVEAFSEAWTVRKDFRIGKLLGEFYVIAGRNDRAREILADPIFAKDPGALLTLAKMEASANPPNAQAAFAFASAGIGLAASEAEQLDFIKLMQGLDLDAARSASASALVSLAGRGNVDAIKAIIPAYVDRAETDPQALDAISGWVDVLAKAGEEAPILEIAARYLTADTKPEVAAKVLAMADRALGVLPADSYIVVLVADAYLQGVGTTKDIDHGNRLIEAASAAGNKNALAELGRQYLYGMGRPRDPDVAITLLDSASALGSNFARVELGRLYSSSTGPRVDMLKAYSMFSEAADSGSTAGMIELGRLYLAGWGVTRDEATGVAWLQRAADLGNTDAMYQLYFHYLAKANPTDEAVALKWLERSSDLGVYPARLRLAERLLTEDRNANYERAMGLLDEAYANGYNLAGKYKRSILANKIAPALTQDDVGIDP